jgi:hypothetical protein
MTRSTLRVDGHRPARSGRPIWSRTRLGLESGEMLFYREARDDQFGVDGRI